MSSFSSVFTICVKIKSTGFNVAIIQCDCIHIIRETLLELQALQQLSWKSGYQ